MSEQKNEPPVAKYRDGSLEVAIWRKAGEKGVSYQTSGVIRSYQDEQLAWKKTNSLSNGELLRASRLLALADAKILELRSKDAEEARQQNAA